MSQYFPCLHPDHATRCGNPQCSDYARGSYEAWKRQGGYRSSPISALRKVPATLTKGQYENLHAEAPLAPLDEWTFKWSAIHYPVEVDDTGRIVSPRSSRRTKHAAYPLLDRTPSPFQQGVYSHLGYGGTGGDPGGFSAGLHHARAALDHESQSKMDVPGCNFQPGVSSRACPPADDLMTIKAFPADVKAWERALAKRTVPADGAGWAKVARDVTPVLRKYNIRIGKQLGCGSFACAYEVRNRPGLIIKITGDPADAAAWQRVIDNIGRRKWPEGLAHVECVEALPYDVPGSKEGALFLMLQQRMTPLTKVERECLEAVDEEGAPVVIQAILGKDRAAATTYARHFGLPPHLLTRLIDTIEWMETLGIKWHDLHGGNVMADGEGRDRKLKIMDLGYSEVPDTLVAVLERPEETAHAAAHAAARWRSVQHARAGLGETKEKETVLLDWVEENEGRRYRPHEYVRGNAFDREQSDWTKKVIELCGSRDPNVRSLALGAWQELPSASVMVESLARTDRMTLVRIAHDCAAAVVHLFPAEFVAGIAPKSALARLERWIAARDPDNLTADLDEAYGSIRTVAYVGEEEDDPADIEEELARSVAAAISEAIHAVQGGIRQDLKGEDGLRETRIFATQSVMAASRAFEDWLKSEWPVVGKALFEAVAPHQHRLVQIVARYVPDPSSPPGIKIGNGGHAKASLGSPALDSQAVLLDWVEEHEGQRYDIEERRDFYPHGSWGWTRKVIELCGSKDPQARALALSTWAARPASEQVYILNEQRVVPLERQFSAVLACVKPLLGLLPDAKLGSEESWPSQTIEAAERWLRDPSQENAEALAQGSEGSMDMAARLSASNWDRESRQYAKDISDAATAVISGRQDRSQVRLKVEPNGERARVWSAVANAVRWLVNGLTWSDRSPRSSCILEVCNVGAEVARDKFIWGGATTPAECAEAELDHAIAKQGAWNARGQGSKAIADQILTLKEDARNAMDQVCGAIIAKYIPNPTDPSPPPAHSKARRYGGHSACPHPPGEICPHGGDHSAADRGSSVVSFDQALAVLTDKMQEGPQPNNELLMKLGVLPDPAREVFDRNLRKMEAVAALCHSSNHETRALAQTVWDVCDRADAMVGAVWPGDIPEDKAVRLIARAVKLLTRDPLELPKGPREAAGHLDSWFSRLLQGQDMSELVDEAAWVGAWDESEYPSIPDRIAFHLRSVREQNSPGRALTAHAVRGRIYELLGFFYAYPEVVAAIGLELADAVRKIFPTPPPPKDWDQTFLVDELNPHQTPPVLPSGGGRDNARAQYYGSTARADLMPMADQLDLYDLSSGHAAAKKAKDFPEAIQVLKDYVLDLGWEDDASKRPVVGGYLSNELRPSRSFRFDLEGEVTAPQVEWICMAYHQAPAQGRVLAKSAWDLCPRGDLMLTAGQEQDIHSGDYLVAIVNCYHVLEPEFVEDQTREDYAALAEWVRINHDLRPGEAPEDNGPLYAASSRSIATPPDKLLYHTIESLSNIDFTDVNGDGRDQEERRRQTAKYTLALAVEQLHHWRERKRYTRDDPAPATAIDTHCADQIRQLLPEPPPPKQRSKPASESLFDGPVGPKNKTAWGRDHSKMSAVAPGIAIASSTAGEGGSMMMDSILDGLD